jgi:ubiquinone/menaquinone biosynthesis C-methylase UbiE
MAGARMTESADQLNREAWSQPKTLRWFERYEGWTDKGEQAAVEYARGLEPNSPILDIGVGAGRTTPLLRAISDDYVAIDFSESMVERSRRKYPGVDIRNGDARDLSAFADASFGLVVFSWNGIDAVDHEDRMRILREVRRVLKPGGVFLFSTHNLDGPGSGEKPWTLRVTDVAHPRHLMQVFLGMPRNIANYRRNRRLEVDAGTWAMKPAAAHNFGIVIHYTSLSEVLQELTDSGFATEPVVFDERTGTRLDATSNTKRTWWFHLVARAPV